MPARSDPKGVAGVGRQADARRRRVRAAFCAARLRAAAGRRRAAAVACRESAFVDTVFFGSRSSFRRIARDRRADGLRWLAPARLAEAALRFVVSFALDGGGGSLTPARRAFDNPIAIACLADRAPCLPSRM